MHQYFNEINKYCKSNREDEVPQPAYTFNPAENKNQ